MVTLVSNKDAERLGESIPLLGLPATTKPIEQIQVGDKVATRDPETGKTEFKWVVSTKVRTATTVLLVALADKATGKVVETTTTTPEHPFNVAGKGFTAAINLAIGNAIVTRAGPALIVQSITPQAHPEGVPVYNFEVEDDHTYFVGLANGGTWVHNNCWNDFQQATRGILKDSSEASEVYGKIQGVLGRARSGASHPFAQDGSVFQNRIVAGRSVPELPAQPLGYYSEYTITTPGVTTRGARRLVLGAGGEVYFTNNHYNTFVRLSGL